MPKPELTGKVLIDVTITSGVKVHFNTDFFTPEDRAEFQRDFFSSVETLEEHALHLAQLTIRGVFRHGEYNTGGRNYLFRRYEGYGFVVVDDEDETLLGADWSGIRIQYDSGNIDKEIAEVKQL